MMSQDIGQRANPQGFALLVFLGLVVGDEQPSGDWADVLSHLYVVPRDTLVHQVAVQIDRTPAHRRR